MLNRKEDLIDKKAKGRILGKRVIFYVLGILILALGVSVSVSSNLGVAPVSSVAMVLSRILQVELGNMSIIVFAVYVLIQILLLGKKFPPVQLLQVVCALLFGKFVTLTSALISWWKPGSYPEQLLMILLSTVLISVGIKLYLTANIVPQAAEGLVQTIAAKGGWKIPDVKNVFDITSVAVALILSLVCTGEVIGLREGTVIAALGVGRVMALLNHIDCDRLRKFIFEEQ